ncbi:hypothetical protein TNCV_4109611 [Trichonephila clavipes]|nr:hypothetical protein TNCV_4109611 [Trichonephila clavipes]
MSIKPAWGPEHWGSCFRLTLRPSGHGCELVVSVFESWITEAPSCKTADARFIYRDSQSSLWRSVEVLKNEVLAQVSSWSLFDQGSKF